MQVAFRLPTTLVEEIDKLAVEIAPPGIEITRTDVARMLLVEALAARRGGKRKPPVAPKK